MGVGIIGIVRGFYDDLASVKNMMLYNNRIFIFIALPRWIK